MKVITWFFATLAGLTLLVFASLYLFLGYSPVYVINAPSVATGIGAKLACSMRYVSEFDEQQAAQDIEVYSPILAMLDYQYNDAERSVVAALGPFARSASFREGIGCYLDYNGYNERASVAWPSISVSDENWPVGNRVDNIDETIQQRLDAMLSADNEQGHDTRALVVVHQGKLVAESYAGGFDASTAFLGWSMTKSVHGMIVGHLHMRGLIELDQAPVFEEWQDSRAAISLVDLLQMTDGLAYEEEYDPGQIAPRMLFQEPGAAEFMLGVGTRHLPGEHWQYSSGTTNLLSLLVHRSIDGGHADDIAFLVEAFFHPIGLASMIYEADATGLLMASSYLFASARDWAKLGQLMLNKGEINGQRLFTEQWAEESLQPNGSENQPDYGYQWWLNRGADTKRWPSLPETAYAAMGNREQRLMVLPEQELVIVRLGWSPKDYRDDVNFSEIVSWFTPIAVQ